jgi:uridine kinase
MDPILGTGSSASRAIQVLLEKGVQESNILFLTLIAAPDGIHTVCKQYPALKVVTSEIDECIDSDFRVSPGVGEFGDRYFGTDN